MTARTKLILETVSVLVSVFVVAVAYSAMYPTVASTGSAPLIIIYELSFYVIMVGCAVVANKLNRRSLFDGLGFRARPVGRQVVIGLAVFAVTISFVLVALALAQDRTQVLSFKARTPLVLFYYLIHSLVFVGVGEELLWRGYFFNRAREITGSGAWAVVLSSVLFGLWHYPSGHDILKVIVTAGIGAIYAVVRWKIRDCSTAATGLAHGLHDSTILVLSYFLL
ncbi:MAG: CPBP family intramembrane glutamic endopeptidase [Coriobacteriia bacterium]